MLSGTAQADEGAAVVVTRGAGAEHCPDGPELSERVQSVRGQAETNPSARYEVAFARDASGLSASIRSSRGASSRVLRDAGPSCSALAQATAVTLALLFDSNTVETPEPTPPPATPRVDSESTAAEPPPKASTTSATLSLGGGALAGVLAPVVPAFTADGGIELAHFRTSLGALAVFPHSTELAPGVVRQSLASGYARTCFSPVRGSLLRFDVCTGIYAGILKGEGLGFTENAEASTPWLAFPLELALRSVSPGFGWEAGAAALVSVRRHEFAIDGVGVAYDSPPVGALFSLRVVGLWAL
ncbi:MAG TPA: hypothetical protein VMS65_15225 [Polyangiaceae bacterium]|nr:hypothetical protein [Polyangiaceae bacterium]